MQPSNEDECNPLSRNPAALARGADRLVGPLSILACILLPVGWFLPLFSARLPFFFGSEVSVMSGLDELYGVDLVLFLAVLVFAVIVPLVKAIALASVWYLAGLDTARRLMPAVELLGKLAMTEIFLIAVLVIGFKGVGIGTVEVLPGLYGFIAIALFVYASSIWAGWSIKRPMPLPSREPLSRLPHPP